MLFNSIKNRGQKMYYMLYIYMDKYLFYISDALGFQIRQ